jgi:hypothetical protein
MIYSPRRVTHASAPDTLHLNPFSDVLSGVDEYGSRDTMTHRFSARARLA